MDVLTVSPRGEGWGREKMEGLWTSLHRAGVEDLRGLKVNTLRSLKCSL